MGCRATSVRRESRGVLQSAVREAVGAPEALRLALARQELWLGCSVWMVRNSSLRSWLRYLDAALLMPALLVLVVLNTVLNWHARPSLNALSSGAEAASAGRVGAPS